MGSFRCEEISTSSRRHSANFPFSTIGTSMHWRDDESERHGARRTMAEVSSSARDVRARDSRSRSDSNVHILSHREEARALGLALVEVLALRHAHDTSHAAGAGCDRLSQHAIFAQCADRDGRACRTVHQARESPRAIRLVKSRHGAVGRTTSERKGDTEANATLDTSADAENV